MASRAVTQFAPRKNSTYGPAVNEERSKDATTPAATPEAAGGSVSEASADVGDPADSVDPMEVEDRLVRGAALVLLRQYRRYTQNRLAELSGISKATISAYERGLQEIGETNRRRMLKALRLPSRAWEATVRHVEWLDWLSARSGGGRGEAPESAGVDDLEAIRLEVERIAEAAGREREREVGTLLQLFAHLLS